MHARLERGLVLVRLAQCGLLCSAVVVWACLMAKMGLQQKDFWAWTLGLIIRLQFGLEFGFDLGPNTKENKKTILKKNKIKKQNR